MGNEKTRLGIGAGGIFAALLAAGCGGADPAHFDGETEFEVNNSVATDTVGSTSADTTSGTAAGMASSAPRSPDDESLAGVVSPRGEDSGSEASVSSVTSVATSTGGTGTSAGATGAGGSGGQAATATTGEATSAGGATSTDTGSATSTETVATTTSTSTTGGDTSTGTTGGTECECSSEPDPDLENIATLVPSLVASCCDGCARLPSATRCIISAQCNSINPAIWFEWGTCGDSGVCANHSLAANPDLNGGTDGISDCGGSVCDFGPCECVDTSELTARCEPL